MSPLGFLGIRVIINCKLVSNITDNWLYLIDAATTDDLLTKPLKRIFDFPKCSSITLKNRPRVFFFYLTVALYSWKHHVACRLCEVDIMTQKKHS